MCFFRAIQLICIAIEVQKGDRITAELNTWEN